MTTTTHRANVNGVNVNQLFENISTLKAQPDLAQFRFRATNKWQDGALNRSSIQRFYGLGTDEHERGADFRLEADEHQILLGEDRAPNPVEFALHALVSCLTTSLVYHAASRGIVIESLESEIEGEIDLRGFLGISKDVRKGYQTITVTFTVKSDASPEKLVELARFSPVYDTISNPVPVTVNIRKV